MLLLLIKNTLAAITFRAVGENCDYAFSRTQTLGDFVRRSGGSASGPATQQSFEFRNLLQRRANFVILNHHDLVGERRIKDLRNKVALADAFNLLWSRRSAAVNGAFRFDQNAEHVAILFSHCSRDAAKSSRRSCPDHDRIDLAAKLFNDLARRGLFMKTRVRIILKWLRHKAAVDRSGKFVATINGALHSGFMRNVFNLTAESFDELHFLFRKASRDAENNTIATRHSHESETDSGIAGSGFDDRRAGL